MGKRILLLATLIILNTNVLSSEKLASILKGKIVASNLSGIQVLIKESDGMILDMADISDTGTFNLDLTIMDTPSLSEVKKLIIEVKRKSGTKQNFQVKKYISNFNDTVLMNPIIFE